MTLHQLGYSLRKIVEVLKDRNITVSKSEVSNVIHRKLEEQSGCARKEAGSSTCGKPKVRTKELIRKVKKAVTGASPLTQNTLARKHGVSRRTIGRIIKEDLNGVLKKKYRVHALSNAQMRQRWDRGPGFLRYIAGNNWKKVLTVDEAWVYLTHINGIRRIYYEFRGERTEESWTKFWKKSHPKGVMFFAGVCYYGKTKLRFVEPQAKINADYYIEYLLKPLVQEDIPRLYSGRKYKPMLHQDSAPAHKAKKTQDWLRNSGIDFIPQEKWLGNSPDLASMDYCVNGIFKWKLFDRQPTTIEGLKRVMTKVWENLDQEKVVNALRAWPNRVQMMIDSHGNHVEHKLSGGKNFENKEN